MKNRAGLLLVVLVAGAVGVGILALVGFGLWGGAPRIQPLSGPAFVVPSAREPITLPPPTEFGEPLPPNRADAVRFTEVFSRLNLAVAQGDARSLNGLFDAERMADEVIRAGGPVNGTRAATVEWATQETVRVLTTGLGPRWVRTEVRVVRWSPDRTEAVVSTVHEPHMGQAGGVITRRWWLTKRPGGWKIYDWEDVATGWRHAPGLSPDPLDGVPPGAGPDGPARIIGPVGPSPRLGHDRMAQRVDVIDRLHDALIALSVTREEFRGDADRLLEPVRGVDLPDPLAALWEMAEGTLLARRGETAKALARFDEADLLAPGIPRVHLARAEALTKAGRFDDAIAAIRAYTREVGVDAAALVAEGVVLESQKRTDDAKAAFRRALDEDPDAVPAFHGLRRVLPDGEKAELGERLAQAREPGTLFLVLIGKARLDGDHAAVAALISAMKQFRPNDPRVVIEEIRALVQAKQYADATAVFRKAAAAVPVSEGRQDIVAAYLLAMTQAGRHLDAYAAVPNAHAAEAFRNMAGGLEGLLSLGGQPTALDTLRSLVAAHRERQPNDPWLWYYEGAVLRAERHYEKAEQVYAAGLEHLEKLGVEDSFAKERFRSRRVDCFYEAKQGMKAYATITPATVTFRYLARRYAADRDVGGLAELVAAHRKRFAGDPLVTYWLAEVHFLKGEYRPAEEKFREFRRGAENEQEWLPARDRQVRCLIRLNEGLAARQVLDAESGAASPALWVAVLAADGDMEALETALHGLDRTPGGLAAVYQDEDVTRLMANPKFAELRKKYPDPRPKPPGKAGM